jgi:hypothetical protein
MLNLLCALILAAGGDDPVLDIVELTSGKKLEGIILRKTDEEVVLAQGSRHKTIAQSKISNLSGPRPDYPEYIRRLKELATSTPTAPMANELADWCIEHGYPQDAKMLRYFALVVDPANEKAHTALGHKKYGDDWKAKLKSGTRVRWETIQERRFDFSDSWEIQTSHFEVKAAGPLDDVIFSCMELEQFYSLYYAQFQEKIGFYELQNRIQIYIYPDLESFPPQSGIEAAYFDSSEKILRSFFTSAGPDNLLHEATHALLFSTGRELERRDPEFPGWLDEGLACYFEAGIIKTPGSISFDNTLIEMPRFRVHRDAGKKMDGLTRVLNYQKGDFWASTGRVRRYAQSYTLVRFLLHSGNDELRESFFRFLSSAYRSKGSTTYFKKTFGKKTYKNLEELWTDWVLKVAGN